MWILADILMFGSVFGIAFILGMVYERRTRKARVARYRRGKR